MVPISTSPLWLVGSGASRDAGMPSIADIDATVFEQEFWRGAGEFLPGDHPDGDIGRQDAVVARVRDTLRWARCMVGSPSGERANYEQVFFLLQQVHRQIADPQTNPAVQPLVEKAEEFTAIAEALTPYPFSHSHDLLDVTKQATRWIAHAVRHKLSTPIEEGQIHQALADCARELAQGRSLVVATLNHDQVLETMLERAGVGWTTGFVQRAQGEPFRVFDRDRLQDGASTVTVLKLHGSVAWTRVRKGGVWQVVEVTGPQRFDAMEREDQDVVTPRDPELLIGTLNKVVDHWRTPFWELFERFRSSLADASHLVVAGYGFRDIGVNQVLRQWMDDDRGRRMVVVDPRIETTRHSWPATFREWWQGMADAHRVVEVCQRLKDVTWQDLSRHLDTTPFTQP